MEYDEIILKDDEYEVVDTGEPRQIESDLVKKKLDGRYPFPIEQDDFEDYTLSDYLTLEEGDVSESIMENKAKAARTALLGAAPAIASTYTGDPSTVTTVLSTQAGAASGLYYNALTESDAELDTAARNSLENFRDLFDDIADL